MEGIGSSSRSSKPTRIENTTPGHPLPADCGMLRLLGRRAPPLRRLFHSPSVPNFTLTREATVEESRLQCSFYEHDATGAQVMHIAADDSNNFFACGVATQPTDSSGVAHILEHTVRDTTLPSLYFWNIWSGAVRQRALSRPRPFFQHDEAQPEHVRDNSLPSVYYCNIWSGT